MTAPVLYETRGPVAIVTLNRPEQRNSVDAIPFGLFSFVGFVNRRLTREDILNGGLELAARIARDPPFPRVSQRRRRAKRARSPWRRASRAGPAWSPPRTPVDRGQGILSRPSICVRGHNCQESLGQDSAIPLGVALRRIR